MKVVRSSPSRTGHKCSHLRILVARTVTWSKLHTLATAQNLVAVVTWRPGLFTAALCSQGPATGPGSELVDSNPHCCTMFVVIILASTVRYRARWQDSGFYSGGARFESRPDHSLSWIRFVIVFLRVFRLILLQRLILGLDHFHTHFEFITYWTSCDLTLYSVVRATGSIVKYTVSIQITWA